LIQISVLLQSQRQSLAQQSQLISIKKQRINNRIALHLALGGDFTTDRGKQAQIITGHSPKGNVIEGNDS